MIYIRFIKFESVTYKKCKTEEQNYAWVMAVWVLLV